MEKEGESKGVREKRRAGKGESERKERVREGRRVRKGEKREQGE